MCALCGDALGPGKGYLVRLGLDEGWCVVHVDRVRCRAAMLER